MTFLDIRFSQRFSAVFGRRLPTALRLSMVLLLLGLATLVRTYLPLHGLPYLFYVPVLMVCGFWLGVGPAILSSVLATLTAEYLFVGVPYAFDGNWTQWANNLAFLVVGMSMAVVCALFRRSVQRLNELNEDLEKQIEQRIRERDQLWELSPDMICTFDRQGRFGRLSPAWQRSLGLDSTQWAGRAVSERMHADDRQAWQDMLERGTATTTIEVRLLRGEAEYRWLSWHIAMQDGVYYSAVRDVTELKAQQHALEKAEEQLRQSQKMEAIGQLTGGLAHDFNNMLAGIMGSHDLMSLRLAQNRTEDLGRYLSMAKGAVERAAALTHRLMAYARRQTLDPRAVDANALVSGMEDLIRRTLGPHVHLEAQLDNNLWHVCCDPHQLDNALLNLSINARDAMPDGGTLTVATGNLLLSAAEAADLDLEAGEYVHIHVTDTGTGMPPDVARRAFDPFFTTKPLGTGTGLGLSMIYGFTKQSKGQTRIRSRIGVGTTVDMYLPRHHGALSEAPSPAAPASSAGRARGTILVVDDDATVRALVVETLRDAGYLTLEAQDGQGGLDRLQSAGPIDALITDVGLPGGMNGRQLADAARTARPGLKALFITGYAESAVVGATPLPPGLAILTKPFTLEALRAQLDQLLH